MATYETILEATVKAGVEHFGGFPPGSMIAFAGKAIPEGWLLCNGALVSRTTYARLFAAIGTAWGVGDGSTTFKLPDADGRVMQGVTDASKVGQYLEAGLPNIAGEWTTGHSFSLIAADGSTCTGCYSPSKNVGGSLGGELGSYAKGIVFNSMKSNNIYGNSATNQPPAIQTLIIIKV